MSHRKIIFSLISSLLLFLMPMYPAIGQANEKPWWPHPLWGPDDEAGASNWISPEKILSVLPLIKTGKVYELGHMYEPSMPMLGQRSYSLETQGPGGPMGKNSILVNQEVITAHLGQVGTQFDGPGHVGKRIENEDGTTKDVFYNGIMWEEMQSPHGLKKLGVEHIKPYITRGILIDIAAYKNVNTIAGGYEVTLVDVRGALKRQNMTEDDIEPGDAIFFNYGWSKQWHNPEKYNNNSPGIGLEVAQWVIERQACLVGSDGIGTEVMTNPNPELMVPVHQELIMKHGIFNVENMVFDELIEDQGFEFLFILTPIRLKGATGSPCRPIAIR